MERWDNGMVVCSFFKGQIKSLVRGNIMTDENKYTYNDKRTQLVSVSPYLSFSP